MNAMPNAIRYLELVLSKQVTIKKCHVVHSCDQVIAR